MALTPLLDSAACSIFDFRIAEEPVRRLGNFIIKYQVSVSSVDLNNKSISFNPSIGSNGDEHNASMDGMEPKEGGDGGGFEVRYDKLILAPGSETKTFGTAGILEHCYTMKPVRDTTLLRERILDCFELASLPTFTPQQKSDILHFIIIGGGPTGVEFAVEIDKPIFDHLLHIYPRQRRMRELVRMMCKTKSSVVLEKSWLSTR
jgi:NADH:ubiquinone reductase (non-electrogenic)